MFEFPVIHEDWRSRVVASLSEIGGAERGPRTFATRVELARAIRLFLESYSDSGGPFQWVASPKDTAAQVAIGRLRYDLSITGHAGFKTPNPVDPPMSGPNRSASRVRAMARSVLVKSLRVRKNERVVVEGWTGTMEAANAFVLEALRLGAQPLLLYRDEPTYWAAATEIRPRLSRG